MKIDVLTLFPGMLEPVLNESILGRAREAGLIDVTLTQIRDYTNHRQRMTDDYPFGGGAGMVMAAQPIVDAAAAVDPDHAARRIYLSPRGRQLNQRVVEELSKEERLLLLCGHYEGVDERALQMCGFEELSIGDYVLTGGELGALVVIDAVARLIPGVLGSDESSQDESFSTGLLEYPQYTRPASFRGLDVPEVLLGGDHSKIEAWRTEQSIRITLRRRPDLLTRPLSANVQKLANRVIAQEALADEMNRAGHRAEPMPLDAADAFAKQWIEAFVSRENRKEAKRACTYDKETRYLHRAFEKGFVAESDVSMENMTRVYMPRIHAMLSLPDGAEGVALDGVYISEDWSKTIILKGDKRYSAVNEEVRS